jgi:regulation of enolase protein 1 (concanavalin A-like superfamily)
MLGNSRFARAGVLLSALAALLFVSPALGFESDDFDRANLDTSRWTFVNPLGEGFVQMSGAGTGDARLELSVPIGPSHDPYNTNRSVRVLQPISDTDFVLEAKFESDPAERYQLQGILIEADASNWIRFDTLHDGTSQRIFSGVTSGGSTSARFNNAIGFGAARHLRISRTGNDWTLETSADGTSYALAGSYTAALAVSSAGVYVANHAASGDGPAYTASIDWVEIGAAPIVDEDIGVEADVIAPFVHRIKDFAAVTDLDVEWYTDEFSTGTVDYGETTAYELGSISDLGGVGFHWITLANLVAGQTYHYRVRSTDGLAQESSSGDFQVVFDPLGPEFDIFYGDGQSFGSIGQPQPWVNVLGHVSDPDGISAIEYSLNGAPAVSLAVGPDGRRLVEAGDFNVDLDTSGLLAGTNSLDLTATDGAGNTTAQPLTFNYMPGTLWPLPVSVDWSTLVSDAEIQDVAQVVDGRFRLDAGNVRTTDPGYDRLVAIGDRTWTDYEFTVPITRHDSPGSYGVGVLLRWDGHTDTPVVCAQPKCGYLPLGSILWARSGRIEIFGNNGTIYASQPRSLDAGITYWYKGRVESQAQGSVYSLKVWEDGEVEPVGWDIVGQAGPGDPQAGSLLLISHKADVSFGNLSVTELAPPPNSPPVAENDTAFVAPGASVEIPVLTNDSDFDGGIDASTVTIVDLPQSGMATPDPVTGRIAYVHDGSPTTIDQFTYTVDDALGETSNIASVNVQVSSNPPAAIVSDDFNRSTLDTDLWDFETPLGDGSVAQIGAGTGAAELRFELSAGTTHNAWGAGGVNEAIRVMQDAADTDFELEVKWNTEPTDGYNDQGILIEQGPSDWLRFDVFHTGSVLRFFVGRTLGGVNTALLSLDISPGSAFYVRVSRIGNTFNAYTSGDGQTWILRHSFVQSLNVSRVGVFAANPLDGLAFTSEVDYFQNSAFPIAVEDANRIELTILGAGSVTIDPDLPNYTSGQLVALTPVPSGGSIFLRWSGDTTGSSSPLQISVTEATRVTAVFVVPVPALDPLGHSLLIGLLALFAWRSLSLSRLRSS